MEEGRERERERARKRPYGRRLAEVLSPPQVCSYEDALPG